MVKRYASKYYDPVKAHEYYMKHRKLKGRKKKNSVKPKNKYKKKSSGKKKGSSSSKGSTKGLNEKGLEAAAIAKQKAKNDMADFNKQLKKSWEPQIKELQNKAKNATGEELEKLKTEIATLQVKYKAQKDTVKKYYDEVYYKELAEIKKNKEMRV